MCIQQMIMTKTQVIKKLLGILLLGVSPYVLSIELAQTPLFVGQAVKPVVMLAMSRDQELYYKAYPDYSNLDGGLLRPEDLTYRNAFNYYGYYDSNWCYVYKSASTMSESYFDPIYAAVNHTCNQESQRTPKQIIDKEPVTKAWSGNFLNWATMTRIDILRKVLFGGKRAVDTAVTTSKGVKSAAVTILERSYLPNESHAFAKVYDGSSGAISNYTPYSGEAIKNGITICNVSNRSGVNGYPTIRVAPGKWANWSHTEIQQCQWRSDATYKTNLDVSRTTSPTLSSKLEELVAKVKVCVPGKDAEGNIYNAITKPTGGCHSYEADSFKPIGILQKKYDSINFGLVTGSWGKPGNGGVLRKKAGPLAGQSYTTDTDTVNEFFTSTGVFNSNVKGIIHNLSLFRIAQFSFAPTDSNKSYPSDPPLDWKNPIGEIYAETLRYLAGTKSPLFDAAEISETSSLTRVTEWDDPVPKSSWCANCSIVVLSSGPNSYDGDDLTDSVLTTINEGLTKSILNDYVDAIGSKEFGAVTKPFYFGAKRGETDYSNQCKSESLNLSALLGRCPEFAYGEGTYAIAGLAHYARTQDIRSGYSGKQTISTYAVELSEGLPNFNIPVGGKVVSIVPVCTNSTAAKSHSNPCSLVGVRVEKITVDDDGKPVSGSYLFFWEDKRWGSDYDMDAVQRLEFCVGSACAISVGTDQIKITNTLPYWATGTHRMHMSYNIQGADTNGLQTTQWVTRGSYDAHNLGYESSLKSLSWYNSIRPEGTDDLPSNIGENYYHREHTYTAKAADEPSLTGLKSPLFYAAKYGKFNDGNNNGYPDDKNDGLKLDSEWDLRNIKGEKGSDGIPDNYFLMKNPSLLEESLLIIFSDIASETASGSGVATNSTRLDEGTYIYQAMFNTKGWFGEIKAFTESGEADVDFKEAWSTKGKIVSESGRKIYSFNPAARKSFEFNVSNIDLLSDQQKNDLGSSAANREQLINWVRGVDSMSGYRKRELKDGTKNLLGDIVTSTPVFAGGANEGHDKLIGADYGGDKYKAYLDTVKSKRTKILYASANDGMLHAINADCVKGGSIGDCGKEVFAYIPSPVYHKFPKLASPGYGESIAHEYLVDGPLAIGDAYIKVGASPRQWRNILVGTMGAGARGLFVLDVTNPDRFGTENVLFEVTALDMEEVGNIFGRPYIAPIDGRWKIVVGNGYNSKNGQAYLLVIDLEEPFNKEFSKAIPTNDVTDNGLAGPALYRAVNTGPVETAYAGDRQGNMWKFTLSGGPSKWAPAFGSSEKYEPLFIAAEGKNLQPITASPTLGYKNGDSVGGSNAVMVYFGTGSYMTLADSINTSTQSFYGIADIGSKVTYSSDRSGALHEKIMKTEAVRTVDDIGEDAKAPKWKEDTDLGWYVDFDPGERITNKAIMAYDRVIFSTLIPNTDGCSFGGKGWLMELVGTGDANISGTKSSLLGKSGAPLDVFIPGEIARLKNAKSGLSGTDTLIYGTADGGLKSLAFDGLNANDESGRLSWRQLQ
ncbi:pilus assembly protein [Cellvibrio mixtus]|uniref:pilus assembly protein n=1 Tax=Cellvibrio mixtus TaxID=39650 RepID=UPI0005880840|nr:PilC/PilY family type IV pilus protein [Cellvibrio mixtus]